MEEWIYYGIDGYKDSLIVFENDLMNGAFISFHKSGKKKFETLYINDKEDRPFKILR